jgi:ABC-type phosphate transport system substrate-binding protein
VLRERSADPTVVAIANEQGEAIQPSAPSIRARRYPLSRSLWLYANQKRFYPVHRSDAWPAIERILQPRTIEESGLMPLAGDEQREAIRLLRGF